MVVARPYAEVGISDEFSYVRIAEVLARTGHVVYTGWDTPMLGWQLYLAAGFIKVFGFSFTVVRASIMLVAGVTAFLCQRTLARVGVNDWNASIGTLVLLMSPLVMPLEAMYMTDIPGLFATVLCAYACLRGIASGTARGAVGWICFAALSNVVFGSCRQIAWLGVLVMVPSAIWILRRNEWVSRVGLGVWGLSGGLIYGINRWFEAQPYTQAEPVVHRVSGHVVYHLAAFMVRGGFEVVLLLLPVLLMVVPALWRKRFPWPVWVFTGMVVLGVMHLWHERNPKSWYAPYLDGVAPFKTLGSVRGALTVAVVVCMLALLTAVLVKGKRMGAVEAGLDGRTVATLFVPFTVAYLVLISPRVGFEYFWDRYAVPLLFIALIFLLRFYQQRFRTYLPVAALVLALCFGGYATAYVHDRAALYRARVAAVDEVLGSGVAATSVSGGWDYDGWTELQLSSHVIGPRMRVPVGVTLPVSTHYGLAHCPWFYCDMFPHVVPRYTISLREDPLLRDAFAPVAYRTWLLPAGTVYVVRFPDRSVEGRLP
jgi:hypothetical protein